MHDGSDPAAERERQQDRHGELQLGGQHRQCGQRAETIGIVVGGNYARNAAEENAVVTVAKLIPGSIAGGGFLLNQTSAGEKAGDAGKRTNFGFNVKNVKSGANFQAASTPSS